MNRRSFFRRAGGLTGAVATALIAGEVLFTPEQAEAAGLPPAGPARDAAVLNFALNLEYLESEYYNLGAFGQTIEDQGIDTSGTGTGGDVIHKANPQVPFQTAALQQYAQEIARDEAAHVKFVRATLATLGAEPAARPTINLLDSFNTVAQNAGIGAAFDPFADEGSFFIGGLSLSDVGVTAYIGGSTLLTSKTVLSGAAGILAVEAYHSSILRTVAYSLGASAQGQVQKISDLRDSLDGNKDKDQGVANADGTANIVPTNKAGVVAGRNASQVLNIVFGSTAATSGLFFPNGVNGPIKS